ncbi:MAG: Lactate-binding periplasmic protein [Syntrophomonadaceae bacterium]|nr:Lactate-binding periplasmic protein [Bacillota bacterium]
MKKRMLLIALVLLTAIVLVAAGCPQRPPAAVPGAPEQPKVEPIVWAVQGFVPAGMLFHDDLLRFAETVKQMSGGRLVFEVHPAGAIVPVTDGLKAAHEGVLDANYSYSGLWLPLIPAAPLFNALPGGFEPQDYIMWIKYGGGAELHQEMYDKHGYNVVAMHAGVAPMEIFQWSNKPIRNLKDMEGLKMRMMPFMGEILAEQGFSVAFLPAGELLPALERGVLDSAEFSTPAFDKTLGFHTVAKYFHFPGIHQPGNLLDFTINRESYEALPEDLRMILRNAAELELYRVWRHHDYLNIQALEAFKANGNVLVRMEEESVETMLQWAREFLDKKAAEDPFTATVLQSQRAWEAKWYPYMEAVDVPR